MKKMIDWVCALRSSVVHFQWSRLKHLLTFDPTHSLFCNIRKRFYNEFDVQLPVVLLMMHKTISPISALSKHCTDTNRDRKRKSWSDKKIGATLHAHAAPSRSTFFM
jgi:hypothetical protein